MQTLTLVVCLSVLCLAVNAEPPWPMPGSLAGFWPLDAEFGLKNAANNLPMSYKFNPKLVTWMNGPFWQTDSSHSVTCDNCYIGQQFPVALTPAFTLSFYFYSQVNGTGGIMSFNGEYGAPRFSLGYSEPNFLEIWGGPKDKTLIGRYPILAVESWNFLALTYEKESGVLRVYDQQGSKIAMVLCDIPTEPETTMFFGLSDRGGSYGSMKTSDAMACVMFYNAVLTTSQVVELPYHCQTKGRGTPKPKPPMTTPGFTVNPWPRPQALVAFWPLNSQYGLNDIGQNRFEADTWPAPTESFSQAGPFGNANSAVSSTSSNGKIFSVTREKMAINGSFTISFFMARGSGTGQGGIFELMGDSAKESLQFRYQDETTIEVSAVRNTTGLYKMILQKNAWTFVAFTFDAKDAMFKVYGRHGLVSPGIYAPELGTPDAEEASGIQVGYASRWKQGLRKTDAISCLMIHSEALTASEIRQAYDACRIVHGAAPCGSPKLPLSPIPTSTTLTTVAKAGQFPYVATIRLGTAVCSATILDAYWLVTSSQCFVVTRDVSFCKAYIGEHDLAVAEPYTREHACSKVIMSGSSPRDIALVELAEPIDFTSQYANDACLFTRENVDLLKLDEAQFVVGWGKNGRHPLLSQTVPRYVPGMTMTDGQCADAWGSDVYKPVSDFCYMSSSNDKNVPCTGDEGSPLLVQARADPTNGIGERLIQIGVYYKRDSKCTQNYPPLFTNIANYATWISEKIACAVPGLVYPDSCPQQ